MNQEDKFERRIEHVEKLIKRRPGISKTELTLATQSFEASEREDIVGSLIDDGIIDEVVTRTGRRPRVNYWHSTDYESPTVRKLAQEVENDPDTTRMTSEQIKSFNERRKELNRHLLRNGLLALKMLPLHNLAILD